MNIHSERKWLPAAVALVLIGGIFAPIAVFGQADVSGQQGQLTALIGAAESSRSYAESAVSYAAANGLSVGTAQAQLSQGNSLLATAQADLQAGTNLGGGLLAVQAAMSDYAAAAESTSITLGNAGLTSSVDYYAALSAVTGVNATIDVVASVEAQACGAVAAASVAQGFVQACAQVNAQVTAARADVSQASSLLVQSSGHVAASANISQALSLVAQARADMQACQSLLLTVASYTYTQRGEAYLTAVVDPLYASANATILSEQSLIANLTGYQSSWTAYALSQGSATANVGSSASALGTAISQVDTGAASISLAAASATAGDVSADMSALLAIAGILALSTLVSAIQACAAATTSYSGALASAGAWSGAYSRTQLSAFSSYLSTGSSDSATVASTGSSFVSAYQTVVADLAPYQFTIPGLQTVYNNLAGLQVSATVIGTNSALSQETSAMGIVQTDISSLNTAVSSGDAAILVSSNLLAHASVLSAEGGAYLNATARSALGEVSALASATLQAAQSYVASAQACLQASVGTYSSAASSLGASDASLGTQTQGSASATATAVTYVQSDSRARTAMAAAGQADLAGALQLFSDQNVSAGVAAMAQASVEFQSASGASA